MVLRIIDFAKFKRHLMSNTYFQKVSGEWKFPAAKGLHMIAADKIVQSFRGRK
jgi:hypothetical protein